MAHHEEEHSGGISHDIGLNGLTYGLALLAGSGVVLMIVALAIGVIVPDSQNTVTLLFLGGLAMMIVGSIGWFGVVRPDTHFDDINIPADGGHGHGHAHTEETAVVAADANKAADAAHAHH